MNNIPVIVDQECHRGVPEPTISQIQKQYSKFGTIRDILRNEMRSAQIDHLGKGVYKIELAPITCTGANVTQYFSIPFLHKIHRVEVKHTDSANVDSVNALTYSLKYGATTVKSLLFNLITNTATIVSDTAHLFSNYYRDSTRYQLITNSTNTELLYVTLIIEIEDEPDKGD